MLPVEGMYGNILFLLVTGAALVLMNIFLPARDDLNNRVYNSFLVSTLEALSGILFVMALSRQIDLHTTWLSNLFQYLGKISLIILILHGLIQDFWGQKIMAVTGNSQFSYWLGFFFGVAGPALLFELFVRENPVASFWLGRKAEPPRSKTETLDVQPAPEKVSEVEKLSVP